ncbi:hypothetical protein OpiT1DRAFT_04643 [Opitutaceae bacterium TAV1]|nr:hypothetical protein OpiT1DRAFT_04643 [Opitutaceae bacterium TAV1]
MGVMRFLTPRFSVLLIAALTTALAAQARIGETQGQIEGRMLREGVGKAFSSWPKNMSPRDRERAERSNPLPALQPYFPEGTREAAYWKTAVRQRINAEEGWRVQVCYFRGVSVLETYQRVGVALNDFEVKAILNLNRGGDQPWVKVEKGAAGESSFGGYGYELVRDGAPWLRAKVQDNILIIFNVKFDQAVFEKRKVETEKEREERQRTQQEKLPESVEGL